MKKPTSVLIYSKSGGTKTSQLYFLAKWLWETQGLITRLISCDGGGWAPFEDSGMIADPEHPAAPGGPVEAFDVSYRALALADIHRLSNGFWPIYGRKTGKEYFTSDEKCVTSPEKFAQIGMYAFEGLTSLASLWLQHISNQEGSVGFKEAWKYSEDGYSVSGLQEGHYGIVQKEMYKLIVHEFERLPVKYFVATALVGASEDKFTKSTNYGPKGSGKADTLQIPSWFQHTLHLDTETIEKDDKIIESKVAYFEEHLDKETEIKYLAKPRGMPEIYPKLKEMYPGGYVKLGFKRGVDKYFESLDRLNKEYREKIIEINRIAQGATAVKVKEIKE